MPMMPLAMDTPKYRLVAAADENSHLLSIIDIRVIQ